jgi:hypothetical protein
MDAIRFERTGGPDVLADGDDARRPRTGPDRGAGRGGCRRGELHRHLPPLGPVPGRSPLRSWVGRVRGPSWRWATRPRACRSATASPGSATWLLRLRTARWRRTSSFPSRRVGPRGRGCGDAAGDDRALPQPLDRDAGIGRHGARLRRRRRGRPSPRAAREASWRAGARLHLDRGEGTGTSSRSAPTR